jgi:hypothetical protein
MPCSMIESRRAWAIIRPLILVGLLVAPGWGQEPKTDGPVRPAASGPEKVVQEQVEAYNRHDIDAFLRTYSPEIKVYDFPDKESASGLEALRERYGKLFKREPDIRVRIAKRIVQGDCVIDQEEVNVGGRQFTATAIYRVKGDKITAVWFLK